MKELFYLLKTDKVLIVFIDSSFLTILLYIISKLKKTRNFILDLFL